MRVGLLQAAPVTEEPAACLRGLWGRLEEARAAGADILVTPEMFLSGYNVGRARIEAAALRADDAQWRDIAGRVREIGVSLAIGLPLLGAGGLRNAAVLFPSDGGSPLQYAKTHLFGETEKQIFIPGDRLSEVKEMALPSGEQVRIALAICYDIEFPEVARDAAIKGADILLCPTANMEPYRSVATRLAPARAEENSLAAAYVNYVGQEGDLTYCGLSCLCDAQGQDVVRLADDAPGLVYGDIDVAAGRARRLETTYLLDRRPELYS